MASSSACGARTTADFGRLDPNTRVERDRRVLARVVAHAVVERGLVDQLVERDARRPADRGLAASSTGSFWIDSASS